MPDNEKVKQDQPDESAKAENTGLTDKRSGADYARRVAEENCSEARHKYGSFHPGLSRH
jgi:hypothetical protein